MTVLLFEPDHWEAEHLVAMLGRLAQPEVHWADQAASLELTLRWLASPVDVVFVRCDQQELDPAAVVRKVRNRVGPVPVVAYGCSPGQMGALERLGRVHLLFSPFTERDLGSMLELIAHREGRSSRPCTRRDVCTA